MAAKISFQSNLEFTGRNLVIMFSKVNCRSTRNLKTKSIVLPEEFSNFDR